MSKGFWSLLCWRFQRFFNSWLGLSPPVRVTTRIITFWVGNPYKPSFPLLLGGGTTQLLTLNPGQMIRSTKNGISIKSLQRDGDHEMRVLGWPYVHTVFLVGVSPHVFNEPFFCWEKMRDDGGMTLNLLVFEMFYLLGRQGFFLLLSIHFKP